MDKDKRVRLKEDEEARAGEPYIRSPGHKDAAQVALRLLTAIPQVKVVEIPAHNANYTCWYVALRTHPKKWIMNLGLYPNATVDVEFRYMQFIDPDIRDKLGWQTDNWPKARISDKGLRLSDVIPISETFVQRATRAAAVDGLKRGGTSAAETVVEDILTKLFKDNFDYRVRPEWLRNPEGNLLELDFFLPELGVAIEVQGPYHFQDFHNKADQLKRRQTNDLYKVRTCLGNGISLVWMITQGIQNELARLDFAEQRRHLADLIDLAQREKPAFVHWTNPGTTPSIQKSVVENTPESE